MKKILFLALFFVWSSCLFASRQAHIIFVDIRLMISSHPLVKSFEPHTRRFIGTPSDPSFVMREGFEGLAKTVDSLESELGNLPKVWAPRFSKASPSEKKKLEKQFLQERKKLEENLLVFRSQKMNIKEFPGGPPFSEHSSILPQVKEITKTIKEALAILQKKYQAKVVLEISNLQPLLPTEIDTKVLFAGPGRNLWKEKLNPEKNELVFQWLQEAKNFWRNNDESLVAIPFGAEDCRMEAVEIMKKILEKK